MSPLVAKITVVGTRAGGRPLPRTRTSCAAGADCVAPQAPVTVTLFVNDVAETIPT